jgi:hypothetical protein
MPPKPSAAMSSIACGSFPPHDRRVAESNARRGGAVRA